VHANDNDSVEVNQAPGMRWPVERTNSWLSSFGQLRRNTDRRPQHRLAQLALAIALFNLHQTHRLAKPLVTTYPVTL